MSKIHRKDFLVPPGKKIKLSDYKTEIEPFYSSKHDYKEELAESVKKLSSLQNLLYANDSYSLLLIFQAMDAAGKDGAIKHVMSGVNPQGCQVFSFKHPSSIELDHDFLWRTTRCLPERGRIGIFNRSYYEEVLIVKVHPEILQAQKIPHELKSENHFWEKRYESILDLERHLYRNGTQIMKFFLHLSPEEQRRRFLDRIDNPEKNWKFSLADIHERKFWKDYMDAYEECISKTTTDHAPWFVIPADDKHNARLIISDLIVEALEELKMEYPHVSDERRSELLSIRKMLD